MKTVCIMCPVGCELTITKNKSGYSVTGNACIRGEAYGKTEATHPMRIVTGLIKTEKGVLPVKTTNLVPKDKICDVLTEIRKHNLKNAKINDIIIKNVCGLDVDIIVTGNYQKGI